MFNVDDVEEDADAGAIAMAILQVYPGKSLFFSLTSNKFTNVLILLVRINCVVSFVDVNLKKNRFPRIRLWTGSDTDVLSNASLTTLAGHTAALGATRLYWEAIM